MCHNDALKENWLSLTNDVCFVYYLCSSAVLHIVVRMFLY